MTLSERIISQALSGGWGAGEGFLARRRREREKKVEKRADLLARPDLLQTRVADVAQVLSLSTRALRTRKYGSKLEALEAQSRGTPQEGFASELLSEYTAALEDPKYIDVSERQLLAGVTETLMTKVPDREGKTRLEKAHRYKWEADTGLGNIFGLFGEDRSVRKLPGYEGWKAKEKVKPRDEWHTGPVEAAAVGAGWTAALMTGSAALGRVGFAIPHPVAKIAGAALMAIPEFMAIDAVRNVLHKTEWARAREGSWKAYVPATIGLVGGGVGARKAITSTIKKAAEKSIFSKGITELLMKDPTAANAIRAGEAQKVAKAAQARVDRVMLKYINREDALKSQFRTAEDYLGAVRGKTREEVAKFDVGAGERWAAYRVGRIGELRREVAKIDTRTALGGRRVPPTAGGEAQLGTTWERILEPFTKGLEVGGTTKPFSRKEVARAYVEGLEFAEVRAAEKTAKGTRGAGAALLDAFQEASGRTKPVSRKKAAKVFTKELSDKGTEAALKKAGKTGKLREAISEQKKVQDLAKKQKKIPEKSKVTVSRERAEARKKKKLQDKISEAAPIAAKAERRKLIKERARIFEERKEGAKFVAEAEPEFESIGKEFKNTISLEEAGLVETARGGVEESMGGFVDNTAKDLVEIFRDSDRLFGVGAAAAVGTTALLGAEEAEASVLVKMGLKAGRKLVETGTKPAKFIGMQERVKKPSFAVVNELDTMSTVAYDPAKHKLVNLPEYEEAVGAVRKKVKEGIGVELSKGDPFVFKDVRGKVHKVVANDYEEAFKKAGVRLGWDGIGEASINPKLSKVRFFEGIPQSSMVEEALLRAKKKMPKVWASVKKFQVIPGDIWKENRAGYFRQDTRTLTVIYDPKHVGLRGYINTIVHELGHAFEGRSGVAPLGEGTFAEDLGKRAMELFDKGKLGLALFGSVPLASLFSPDSVEAAGFSKIGIEVPKVIAGLLKEAPSREEMLKLVKEMKDAGLLHIPIAKGAKEVKYVQSTISTAKQAVEKNNNLIRNIKAETTPFGNWLTAKLSPYTTGNIL